MNKEDDFFKRSDALGANMCNKKISWNIVLILCCCVLLQTACIADNENKEDLEPGQYKLLELGASDQLCKKMQNIINDDITQHGKIRFDELPIFSKWEIVENLEPQARKEIGDIFKQSIDIDNDGKVETVYKVLLFAHGRKTDGGLVVYEGGNNPEKFNDGINYRELFEYEDMFVSSLGSARWRTDPMKWELSSYIFNGQAVYYPFLYEGVTYIAANNYFAPINVPAIFYVFSIRADGERKYIIQDKCYMEKILPPKDRR
jgi:hypothetical protein